MNLSFQHNWDLDPAAAVALQNELRPYIVQTDQIGEVQHVAGVDVGFEEDGKVTRAAVAVLSFPELKLVTSAVAHRPTTMPYVPGLLSFREIPAVLVALEKLKTWPDLLLCDGQGIAHPRRLGIASHLGLLVDVPAIGVAKSRLIGRHKPVGVGKGSRQPLIDKGEIVGMVLRTRANVKPVYVSVGHRVSLETAVGYVLHCTPKYRLPETTRQAHKLASGPI
jgi:deoxyribonuclease V